MLTDTRLNETIVFIARETGWTLEYIRNLPLPTVRALVDELSYQKRVDDYNMAYNFALLMCTMSSKQVKPESIVGPPPKRTESMKEVREDLDLWTIAKQEGIQVPV